MRKLSSFKLLTICVCQANATGEMVNTATLIYNDVN